MIYKCDTGSALVELQAHISEAVKLPRKFGVQYLGVRWESNERLAAAVQQLRDALASAYGGGSGGLLIITCQRPLQPIFDLLRRRKACESAMAASVWSEQLESELIAKVKDANLGRVGFAVL
jgi:hypothetical protein